MGRKEARPPGGPLLRGGWGTKACTGRCGCELRVSVGVCAKERLAVLVSPSHLHLLPPPPSLPPRRRKEAWEIFGWIFPACLPRSLRRLSPGWDGGLGAQKVYWRNGPPWVCGGQTRSLGTGGGACPSPCPGCLSPSSPAPRLVSLHFLSQTPVSGRWVGLRGLRRAEEAALAAMRGRVPPSSAADP